MIKTDKDQIMELWKLCFDDSDEFIDLYFRLRFNKEVSVFLKSADHIISSLQMLPYPFTYYGNTLQSSYISGACTHPDYRNLGAMRNLLSLSFAKMLRNGVSVSTLIPADDWLFEYYRTIGYESIFNYSTIEIDLAALTGNADNIETTTDFRQDVYDYFNQKMQKRKFCVQHTREDVKVILSDMKIDNGFVAVASRESSVVGVAFVYQNDDAFYIAELFSETERVKQQLFQAIHNINRNLKIVLICPPQEKEENITHGMLRVINAENMLRIYAQNHPDEEINIFLEDAILSSNSGIYHIHQGKCIRLKGNASRTDNRMNMNQLAKMLFKDTTPYMSLMMD
jgi:predicted acetyltransferase